MTTQTLREGTAVERCPRAPVVRPGSPLLPGGPGIKPRAAGVRARPAAGPKPPVRTVARGAVRAGTSRKATDGRAPRPVSETAPAGSEGRAAAGGARPGQPGDGIPAHGTKRRYLNGPDKDGRPGRGCRCTPCKEWRNDRERDRRRQQAYGRWQPFVDAEPVRAHVRALGDFGMGYKRVARLAGVGVHTVHALLYGNNSYPPSAKIRPETAQKLLTVKASKDALGGGTFTDPTGTRRRLQALIAIGWTIVQLADRLHSTDTHIGRIARDHQHVTVRMARAVSALYNELWDQPPPEPDAHAAAHARKARELAQKRGWPPPQAWDDDTIDNPAAGPADGWQRPKRRSTADLAAEGRELIKDGTKIEYAAERLGVSRSALQKALDRTKKVAA